MIVDTLVLCFVNNSVFIENLLLCKKKKIIYKILYSSKDSENSIPYNGN